MTRVDFYVLQDVALSAMHRFACRLAAKALSNDQQVIMHTADETSARELDELLWHYPDRRFLPHAVQGDSTHTKAPVLITWQQPGVFEGVLVNLATEIPNYFNRFHRVAEIIVQDNRDQGRERYKFYKHRGYPLYDHQIDEWETESHTA